MIVAILGGKPGLANNIGTYTGRDNGMGGGIVSVMMSVVALGPMTRRDVRHRNMLSSSRQTVTDFYPLSSGQQEEADASSVLNGKTVCMIRSLCTIEKKSMDKN